MKSNFIPNRLNQYAKLLRWDKPSGRLILLIPAGWALWMAPTIPPRAELIALIICGGLFISGAGCIANDLWDKRIDSQVARTKDRPLASGSVKASTALALLFLMLSLSFSVVMSLPEAGRTNCLILALLALPPILIYPSAKRWFNYPQAILAICWGFAVLIPWAASEANSLYSTKSFIEMILSGGWPLFGIWLATIFWTFGFDTVYAMADREDDQRLGIRSSAISLHDKVITTVAMSYAFSGISFAIAAMIQGISWIFWPIWLLVFIGMQYETSKLKDTTFTTNPYGKHFKRQVLLGALLILSLILGRLS